MAVGDQTTDDECFNGEPSVYQSLLFACAIQDGTINIGWILTPQPPDGTHVSWSTQVFDGVGNLAPIYALDSYSPSVLDKGPYQTIESIRITQKAFPAMDYLENSVVTCTNTSTTCYPGQIGIGILCSEQLRECPEDQIQNNANGKFDVVASPMPVGTPSTVVGLLQDMTESWIQTTGHGPYSETDVQWGHITGQNATPPLVVKGYTFSDAVASPTPMQSADLTTNEVKFYWVGKGNVQRSIAVASRLMRADHEEIADPIALAAYIVDSPTGSQLLNATFHATSAGNYRFLNSSAPGGSGAVQVQQAVGNGNLLITSPLVTAANTADLFQLAGKMPNVIGGVIGIAQLVDSHPAFYTLDSGFTSQVNGETHWGDDGCALLYNVPASTYNPFVPYNSVTEPFVYGAGNTINPPPLIDAPALTFIYPPDELSGAADDEFYDYVMFRPSGKSSIWVALEKLPPWRWAGTARRLYKIVVPGPVATVSPSGGVPAPLYTLQPGAISPEQVFPNRTAAVDTAELPVWDHTISAQDGCPSTTGN